MVDGTVLGTTIVSLMVNGLCCAYQQKEEKEHREAIRRDLRAEYWQQRLMDLEIEHRRGGPSGEEREEASPTSSVVSEERRRKLQQDKQRAVQHHAPAMVITPTSSAAASLQNTQVRRSGSRITDLMAPNQMIKTTSLMDDSDDESDSDENEARYRSNSLFDEDDSQEIKHVDEDGFVEVSLV